MLINNIDANISFVGSEKAVQLLNEDSGHPKAIYGYQEELFERAKMHGNYLWSSYSVENLFWSTGFSCRPSKKCSIEQKEEEPLG